MKTSFIGMIAHIGLVGFLLCLPGQGMAQKLSANEYVVRGDKERQKDNYDAAIAEYDQALALDPKLFEAYEGRGIARVEKNDLDGALADFSRTVELNPKAATVYFNRAIVKSRKKDFDGALKDYDLAIERDPKYVLAFVNRGSLTAKEGDFDRAMADFNAAIELDPKQLDGRLYRANIKWRTGDFDGALADYNNALEIDPKRASIYKLRGNARFQNRAWTDALGDYRHFCELSENKQEYPRILIWLIRSRLGETEAANKEFAAFLDNRWKAAPGDWFSRVAGHLIGKVSESDLMAAAASPEIAAGNRTEDLLCEGWYYAGMKKLLAGDKEAAIERFRKCVAVGRRTWTEYNFALSELKALGQ